MPFQFRRAHDTYPNLFLIAAIAIAKSEFVRVNAGTRRKMSTSPLRVEYYLNRYIIPALCFILQQYILFFFPSSVVSYLNVIPIYL